MERRRSRSPLERKRSRSRSREKKDEMRRRDSDDRTRSSRDDRKDEKKPKKEKEAEAIDVDSLKGADKEMAKLMGFVGFNTTKNKKVAGNSDGAVQINKPRRYRQYMNRKGGFNRPLDYVA
ncbi:unnamed protein product [Toxocara canis]|uniref:U4/U6.U5 small nuclear ribonucleoprotein 27 kDa protein n=1 Tax=Toxocara canis TaxID=6265 RepID=A0A183UGV6_TOXCA|nr:unnamed protein product [Toxocara canis]